MSIVLCHINAITDLNYDKGLCMIYCSPHLFIFDLQMQVIVPDTKKVSRTPLESIYTNYLQADVLRTEQVHDVRTNLFATFRMPNYMVRTN